MTLGPSSSQPGLLKSTAYVGDRVPGNSIWNLLGHHGGEIFPDEMFADLYSGRGRRSIPPRIVATVMVLQRLHGLSDRDAVEAFEWDTRWKFACGALDYDGPGFSHTVLVSMRARLARSGSPRRIFEKILELAREAKLVSAQRVLDSTPLYDAVATQDTVTMLRASVRLLLREAESVGEGALASELRAALRRDDDYRSPGKPVCEWSDPEARAALVHELASDVEGCLGVLEGRELPAGVGQAGELCAAVVGQDLEQSAEGRFRIARRVARDRIISTVDSDARHGHKTSARGFDGYKGHIAIDPGSELITNTVVTAGNVADGQVAEELITDLLEAEPEDDGGEDGEGRGDAGEDRDGGEGGEGGEDGEGSPRVYGDAAYGTGAFQEVLEQHGIESRCRTQEPVAPAHGGFSKSQFAVDLEQGTVTCPADVRVPIRPQADGSGIAYFGRACSSCPLREQCTSSVDGRTVSVSAHETALQAARARQRAPAWQADYRAIRPGVERKIAHLQRRKHGGRYARVRGREKVDADYNLLAGAVNLMRMAVMGLGWGAGGWAVAAPG